MPKQVAVRINSVQDDGSEKNKISTNTTGQLYKKGTTYYLKYEGVAEGLEGVNTTVKIKDNKVKLIRRGKIETRQEFIPEEETNFDYQTPYGMMKFSIIVQELDIDIASGQGEVKLDYELLSEEGVVISNNYLHLEYEEE